MMLLSLIKKDFLLVKKYLLIFIIFAIGAPIFLSKSNSNIGFLGFVMTALVLEYILNFMIWQIEDKYKGSILLCTTPYTRRALVEAKYLLVFIVFICNCIIYAITKCVVPSNTINISISQIGIAILIIYIFFDMIIPALYEFGFIKLRNILVMVIVIVPFISNYIAKWLQSNNINLQYINSLPKVVQNLGPYILTLIITFISITLSINIYSKKDL